MVMEYYLPKFPAPRDKPRRFQFSLRSLLIFTVLCGIMSAGVAKRIERKRRELDAVMAIRKVGGSVRYDYQSDKAAAPPGPKWLRNMLGENIFSEVDSVDIFGNGASDSDLEHVAALTRLKMLHVWGARVTDAGVKHLKGLTQLQVLFLDGTNVSNAAVDDIQKALPNCEIIR